MEFGNDSMSLVLFEQQAIRRIWHDGRWFYSVIDAVASLVPGTNPRKYWFDMKRTIKHEGFTQLIAECRRFPMIALDGKMRETDCAEIEALIAIVKMMPALRRYLRPNLENRRKDCGVYAIENTITGERYIGSSADIPARFVKHRSELRRGTHHSSILQAAWDHYKEDAFVFILLAEVPDIFDLENVEQEYINDEKPAYNSATVATNISTLRPIEDGKIYKFILFLREHDKMLVDSPLSKLLHIMIDQDIVYPGPNVYMIAKAEQLGITAWEDFGTFLHSRTTHHESERETING